jgi:hypothetical protein
MATKPLWLTNKAIEDIPELQPFKCVGLNATEAHRCDKFPTQMPLPALRVLARLAHTQIDQFDSVMQTVLTDEQYDSHYCNWEDEVPGALASFILSCAYQHSKSLFSNKFGS